MQLFICATGEPSPPDDLRDVPPSDISTIKLEWGTPVHTGGSGSSIQKYGIRIPEIGYYAEESDPIHIITTDGTGVELNVNYMVQVTAINTCELESDPTSISIIIVAIGKYMYYVMYVRIYCGGILYLKLHVTVQAPHVPMLYLAKTSLEPKLKSISY